MAANKSEKTLKDRSSGHNKNNADTKKGASKLKEKNEKENTFNFNLVGMAAVYAGQNIKVKDFGKFDGMYFINTVEHTIGNSGYTININARNSDLDKDRQKDVQDYNSKNGHNKKSSPKNNGGKTSKRKRGGSTGKSGKNNKTVYLDKNGNPVK